MMTEDNSAITRILEQVHTWSAPRAAAAVFDHGGIVAATGDMTSSAPVASLTKLVTAWAVLVAVEEQSVGLGDPAGPEGSTVLHLLCHASGLPFEGTLPIAVPGMRRIYSNAGYAALSARLEAATGIAFRDYASAAVLEPLGMAASTIEDVAGGSGRASAAAGLRSNIVDLVALGVELLSPTLMDVSTWTRATSVCMPELAGVLPGWGLKDPCPWGLGPEIRGSKSPHWTGMEAPGSTFGHFGASGSFIWVDPDGGFGCVVITDRPFGGWAVDAWPGFSDAVRRAMVDNTVVQRTPPPEQPDEPPGDGQ